MLEANKIRNNQKDKDTILGGFIIKNQIIEDIKNDRLLQANECLKNELEEVLIMNFTFKSLQLIIFGIYFRLDDNVCRFISSFKSTRYKAYWTTGH